MSLRIQEPIPCLAIYEERGGKDVLLGTCRHPDAQERMETQAKALRAEGKVVRIAPWTGPTAGPRGE